MNLEANADSAGRSYETSRKQAWRWKKGRAYADARNEKIKDYQSTFVGKMALRAGWMNRVAKSRGACGRISSGDIVELWALQNGIDLSDAVRCAACGTVTSDWHADHIVPIKDGGAHELGNLQLLCVGCHQKKTRQDRDAYAEQSELFAKPNQRVEIVDDLHNIEFDAQILKELNAIEVTQDMVLEEAL